MIRHWAWIMAAAGAAVALAGCGGGGTPGRTLTGVVTDVDGKAVAGAYLSLGSARATSLSNGTFVLNGVSSGYQTVVATITIQGNRWSGETGVDVVPDEQNRSVNVVVSQESTQGALAGSVIGPSGYGLEGAKVFIGGPVSSTIAFTDADGNYVARRLTSGTTYTVTASLAGYVNDTRSVHIDANQTTAASFALASSSAQGPIPAPQNVQAQAWTIASSISRSSSKGTVYDWLKRVYRKKKGLPLTASMRNVQWKTATRATPAGSVMEIDLFWDYASYTDLLGYLIRRGTSSSSLGDLAVARDPLTAAFFDVDSGLTQDVTYYYTVHSLDTIGFPNDGTVGPASSTVSASPLGPIRATSPAQGAQVSGDPLFQWTAVTGASTYQIYVWDRFPDLQNSSDPDGVSPIWPADTSNPGASLVSAPQTQQGYAGPTLQSGHTYYWLVLASDASGSALSASQVAKLVAR